MFIVHILLLLVTIYWQESFNMAFLHTYVTLIDPIHRSPSFWLYFPHDFVFILLSSQIQRRTNTLVFQNSIVSFNVISSFTHSSCKKKNAYVFLYGLVKLYGSYMTSFLSHCSQNVGAKVDVTGWLHWIVQHSAMEWKHPCNPN